MAEDDNKSKRGNRPAVKGKRIMRCSSIITESRDAIFVCGLDGLVMLANPAFADLLGVTPEQIHGCRFDQIRHVEIANLMREQNAAVLVTCATRIFEFKVNLATGLHTFHVTKGLHHDKKGRVVGIFGVARDISEQREIEREIIDTSDKEKQRLGRELRENFCQHLVGISLLGNALHEELVRLGIPQAEDARQIAKIVKEVVAEVRAVEKGLSAIHLEQGEGLVDALEDLAEQVRASGETECSFRISGVRPALELQTAMYLFRIAQEAVHNALDHSGAQHIQIRLSNKRESVILSIRDDGSGFSTVRSQPFELRYRVGFPIMHYRSRAIGAKLEIKHLRHGGVEVICTVPKNNSTNKKLPRRSPRKPLSR